MREMSGRLEEMPGEEGYPAYLPSRIADFYERAGKTICLGSDNRKGSLSVVGAVSPPGGDLSDPVVQATLKVVKVFWALEDQLAFERHFPAIGWLTSYSLYHDNLVEYFQNEVDEDWSKLRIAVMNLLQKESELKELVRLVGLDSLSNNDRMVLETSKSIREDFLQQSAFDPDDEYTKLGKQYKMLR
jgi:V/A-type H+-transporting ATPase subunit A